MSHLVLWETKVTREESIHASSFDDAATKLILLSRAKSERVAFTVESNHVIVAADGRYNVFETVHLSKGGLSFNLGSESKDTFVALWGNRQLSCVW